MPYIIMNPEAETEEEYQEFIYDCELDGGHTHIRLIDDCVNCFTKLPDNYEELIRRGEDSNYGRKNR